MIKFNILIFKIYFIIWPPRKNYASFVAAHGDACFNLCKL